MKKGILYGVGVGPGDPELMTLRAVRRIRENTVIAFPGEIPEETTAYRIAVQAVPELSEKILLPIPMPMTQDAGALRRSHHRGANSIAAYLKQGQNVVFLTLGDVTIYSTFAYLKDILEADGYETRMENGIPSFCAAAARLNTSLVEWNQSLWIIPAAHASAEALFTATEEGGTVVLMKAGKSLSRVKEIAARAGATVQAVANCGLPGECVCKTEDQIPESSGYFTTVIVKSQEEIEDIRDSK